MNQLVKVMTWVFAGAFFATAMTTMAQASECGAGTIADLNKVGETRLRVMLFRVYDAALYTDSGQYPEFEKLALRIDYLRSISSRQLVAATEEEWEKLGYDIGSEARTWLTELGEFWPDVRQGDCLTAVHQASEGVRFYNADGILGEIDSSTFAERFVAIWLDANSSFRRNRDQLVGER
ncbi:MAG: chalcone isomerase family protein [Idiomarina sp.]|nr:chalcone isomerase family protein [Idiomarina sp.]